MNLCECARLPVGPVALADLIAILAAILAAGLHISICFRWQRIALLPLDLLYPWVLFAAMALKSGGSSEAFFLLYLFFLWPVMFVCYSGAALYLFLGWQKKRLAVRLLGVVFVFLVPFVDLVVPGKALVTGTIRAKCPIVVRWRWIETSQSGRQSISKTCIVCPYNTHEDDRLA